MPVWVARPATQGPRDRPARQAISSVAGAGVVSVGSNALTNTDAINTNAQAWSDMQPTVTITGVTIASPPVVLSSRRRRGTAIIGLGSTPRARRPRSPATQNLAFIAREARAGADRQPEQVGQLHRDDGADHDHSRGADASHHRQHRHAGDHGDGTYKYTFYRDVTTDQSAGRRHDASAAADDKADLGDLTYDPSAVHRLTIQISGNAPGTGTNTADGSAESSPAVPHDQPGQCHLRLRSRDRPPVAAADPAATIVANANCNECHGKLGGIPGDSPESSAPASMAAAATTPRYCVVCHTEQRKYGRTDAASTSTDDSPSPPAAHDDVDGRADRQPADLIHKIHMGELLVKKNYNYGGVMLNETLFPQDIRNCTKCHDGSATSAHEDAAGRQLEERAEPPRLRRLPRRHQLRHRQGRDHRRRRPGA